MTTTDGDTRDEAGTGTGTATGAATDFREVLKRKMEEKRTQLGKTEENIKKYTAPSLADKPGADASGAPGGMGRFQNRLGPPTGGHRVPGRALGARLGPRVDNRPGGPGGRQVVEEEKFGSVASKVTGGGGGLLSRVVVDNKSREEVMAEKRASEGVQVQNRNKRMFGNLLGTLARFRQDETRVKEREAKKKEVEQKIEERTEKEREEARMEKRELFVNRKKQEHELKVLQVRSQCCHHLVDLN